MLSADIENFDTCYLGSEKRSVDEDTDINNKKNNNNNDNDNLLVMCWNNSSMAHQRDNTGKKQQEVPSHLKRAL
jgi:hypothetical protein